MRQSLILAILKIYFPKSYGAGDTNKSAETNVEFSRN